jgi:hypothetical protein
MTASYLGGLQSSRLKAKGTRTTSMSWLLWLTNVMMAI